MKIENNRDKKTKAQKKSKAGLNARIGAGCLLVNIYIWAGLGAGLSLLGYIELPDAVLHWLGGILIAYVIVSIIVVSAYGVKLMIDKED